MTHGVLTEGKRHVVSITSNLDENVAEGTESLGYLSLKGQVIGGLREA